jgi:hypothetical protein
MEWIYQTDFGNTVRYTLGTLGSFPLICIGVNPSTASPEKLDNTIRSVERLAFGNGFDSWIMVNLYPLRETNPDLLPKEIDPVIHRRNLEQIERLLSATKPRIWAAWGTLISKRDFLRSCLQELIPITRSYDCQWFSIGNESRSGHPHHPLYLRSDEKIKVFDIESYFSRISQAYT